MSPTALRASDPAGADALIVQGVEAGGHAQSVVGLLPLLAEVQRTVSLPVLAAGGIGDPASARATLAGAQAVVMGTRFLASEESDAHPIYKASLLDADARDSVLTGLFDVGWEDSPHRVLRNSTYERWEDAGAPPNGERPGEGDEIAGGSPRYASNPPLADMEGDIEAMAMYAGQSVGAITAAEPAAAIVERFAAALRTG